MFIEFLIILIDIAFTVLLTLFCIPVGNYYHYWSPFLLLIAGYILGFALMWIVLSIFASFYPKDKEYKTPSKWAAFWLTQSITYINHHALIRLKVTYDEPLPKGRFLLVCNHMSKFDPMLLVEKYGMLDLAFISKPTNFKIPIGAHFMKGACYQSIDRYDKLQSLQVMNEATRLISENLCSIGVFPEGTRHNSISEFGEFHEGVFGIATKAKCPIVIATIVGSDKIHSNFPKRSTKVHISIIRVMYPEYFLGRTVKSISDEVHSLMWESIEPYK